MNPASTLVSTSAVNTSQLSPWTRLKSFCSKVFGAIRARFRYASLSYRQRWELGERIALAKGALRAPGQGSAKSIRQSAILLPLGSAPSLPLFEGSQYLVSGLKGYWETTFKQELDDRDRYEMKVEQDEMLMNLYGEVGTLRKFVSNDIVELGKFKYLLKILPEEYRRDQPYFPNGEVK